MRSADGGVREGELLPSPNPSATARKTVAMLIFLLIRRTT